MWSKKIIEKLEFICEFFSINIWEMCDFRISQETNSQ